MKYWGRRRLWRISNGKNWSFFASFRLCSFPNNVGFQETRDNINLRVGWFFKNYFLIFRDSNFGTRLAKSCNFVGTSISLFLGPLIAIGSGIKGEQRAPRQRPPLSSRYRATIEERTRGIRARSRVCRDDVYGLVISSQRDNAAIFSVYYAQCTHVYATRARTAVYRSIDLHARLANGPGSVFAFSRILYPR